MGGALGSGIRPLSGPQRTRRPRSRQHLLFDLPATGARHRRPGGRVGGDGGPLRACRCDRLGDHRLRARGPRALLHRLDDTQHQPGANWRRPNQPAPVHEPAVRRRLRRGLRQPAAGRPGGVRNRANDCGRLPGRRPRRRRACGALGLGLRAGNGLRLGPERGAHRRGLGGFQLAAARRHRRHARVDGRLRGAAPAALRADPARRPWGARAQAAGRPDRRDRHLGPLGGARRRLRRRGAGAAAAGRARGVGRGPADLRPPRRDRDDQELGRRRAGHRRLAAADPRGVRPRW